MSRETNYFMTNLTQAARDNPLAAALIGGGALWLMFGNRALGGVAAGMTSVVQPLAEAGMRGVSSTTDAMSSASGRATDTVTDIARSVTRAAGDASASATAAIKDRMADTVNRTADTFRSTPNPVAPLEKGYASARSTLSDLLERQPLVLGAIGIAIGAGVASAVAGTTLENEWAGSLSDDVKDAVKGRAGDVAAAAQRAAGEVGSEFRAAAGETVGKLRKTGEEAVETVRETATAGRH